jgi:hypothetical protein
VPASEAPGGAIVEIKLVRLLRAGVVEVVIAEQVLVWREFDVVYGGFTGFDEIVLSALREGEDREGPECAVMVVAEVRDELDPVGGSGV